MIAYKSYEKNVRYNQKGLNRRRRILQQDPCHQIQPYRKEKKVPKPSKEERFRP